MRLILQTIPHVSKTGAFRVPGWNIDGSLSAIESICEVTDGFIFQVEQPEFDLPAKGMGLLLVFEVGNNGSHLVIG